MVTHICVHSGQCVALTIEQVHLGQLKQRTDNGALPVSFRCKVVETRQASEKNTCYYNLKLTMIISEEIKQQIIIYFIYLKVLQVFSVRFSSVITVGFGIFNIHSIECPYTQHLFNSTGMTSFQPEVVFLAKAKSHTHSHIRGISLK